jgi:hypothetical protein
MAEGLDRARIADLRAGLSDGARAAFLDARLSEAERQIVVTALSHDPEERAEISSAADLLDCVGTDLIPLPPGVLAKAAAAFAAENSAADHSVAVPGRRIRQRQGLLIVGVGLAAFVLVMTAVAGLLSPGDNELSAGPVGSVQPTAQSATKPSAEAAADRALDHAIGQFGKDLIDPRCTVHHRQTDGSGSRSPGRSLAQWCMTHAPITRVHSGRPRASARGRDSTHL